MLIKQKGKENFMRIKELFDAVESKIIEDRRWFHRHPEVSLQEKMTSEQICKRLEEMGIAYEMLPPNYGIVATIEGKTPGKTLALRADIDALPVTEDTGLPFASEHEGKMHACGHDAHAAMLLGAAKVLNEVKDEFTGTLKLVFQVAEETGDGYQEVLDYFEKIGGVDGVAGVHIWSAIPEGQMLLYPGAVFAGAQGYIATIEGRGGHGARPDLTHDPIKAACDLALKFSSIPSNFYDVLDYSVVNVGVVEAGTLGNIIPGQATLKGGMRFYKDGGGDKIVEIMERMAKGVDIVNNVKTTIEILGGVPPIINNIPMVEEAKEVLDDMDGLRIADQKEAICASDNYGYFLQAYPGLYAILGGGKPGEEMYPQHHAKFDVDEKSFRKGAEFMARYAMHFLK